MSGELKVDASLPARQWPRLGWFFFKLFSFYLAKIYSRDYLGSNSHFPSMIKKVYIIQDVPGQALMDGKTDTSFFCQ